jgi:hypothetical protein
VGLEEEGDLEEGLDVGNFEDGLQFHQYVGRLVGVFVLEDDKVSVLEDEDGLTVLGFGQAEEGEESSLMFSARNCVLSR